MPKPTGISKSPVKNVKVLNLIQKLNPIKYWHWRACAYGTSADQEVSLPTKLYIEITNYICSSFNKAVLYWKHEMTEAQPGTNSWRFLTEKMKDTTQNKNLEEEGGKITKENLSQELKENGVFWLPKNSPNLSKCMVKNPFKGTKNKLSKATF